MPSAKPTRQKPGKPAKRKAAVKRKPAKRGRPPKPIDLALVEKLAHIQCTDKEIAYLVGMTPEGFCLRKKGDDELLQCLEKAREQGKASLRRVQWQAAQSGDRTMLVWLGKQYLDQKDVSRHEQTGKDGGPIETKDVGEKNEAELWAAFNHGKATAGEESDDA